MNKICILYLFSLFSYHSYADQAKINITSKVLENTCAISSGSTDFVVNMTNSNLRKQPIGIPFGNTSFSITLDNCPENVNIAHVIFSGESDPIKSNLLKITDSKELSTAKGIAIGLYNDKGNNIDISKNNTDFLIKNNVNNYILKFSAAYIKTTEVTSSGKIIAVAYFDITYE